MSQLASADTPRLGDRRAQDRLGDDLRPDAKVLAEGPGRHAGNYYLSTDVLNGTEIAGVLSRVTDRPIRALIMTPDDLAVGIASGQRLAQDGKFRRANSGSRLTYRWREMDSNCRFRITNCWRRGPEKKGEDGRAQNAGITGAGTTCSSTPRTPGIVSAATRSACLFSPGSSSEIQK